MATVILNDEKSLKSLYGNLSVPWTEPVKVDLSNIVNSESLLPLNLHPSGSAPRAPTVVSRPSVVLPKVSVVAPRPPAAAPKVPAAPPKVSVIAPRPPTIIPKAPTAVPKVSVVAPRPPAITPKAPTAVAPPTAPKVSIVAPRPPAATPKVSVSPPKASVAAPRPPVITPKAPTTVAPRPVVVVPKAPTAVPKQSVVVVPRAPITVSKASTAAPRVPITVPGVSTAAPRVPIPKADVRVPVPVPGSKAPIPGSLAPGFGPRVPILRTATGTRNVKIVPPSQSGPQTSRYDGTRIINPTGVDNPNMVDIRSPYKSPRSSRTEASRIINFPRFNTTMKTVNVTDTVPVFTEAELTSDTSMVSQSMNISEVLAEIDFGKLQAGRTGASRKVYDLKTVMDFARRLGISTTERKKHELVSLIIEMKDNL